MSSSIIASHRAAREWMCPRHRQSAGMMDRYSFEAIFMEKVNIQHKLSQFQDYWSPRIVGELNGQQVKLVKFQGEFVWHHHENEDELFLIVKGRFRMDFRDRQVWLEEGELLIVPRGASSIGRSRLRKFMCCCSSPHPRSTPAT